MAHTRQRDFPNAVWHVTNRVNWQAWRLAPEFAYRSFIFHLERCLKEFGMDLLAFTVMSNHFHTLLRSAVRDCYRRLTGRRTSCRHFRPWPAGHQKSEVLSQFVKELKRRVAREVQAQLEIGGHFWERPHDRVLVTSPTQLVFAIAYDHRNPVRAGMHLHPEDYARSSARWWADGSPCGVPLCTRPDLPFDLPFDYLRKRVLQYQASKRVDDVMEALAKAGIPPQSDESWAMILRLIEDADLPKIEVPRGNAAACD